MAELLTSAYVLEFQKNAAISGEGRNTGVGDSKRYDPQKPNSRHGNPEPPESAPPIHALARPLASPSATSRRLNSASVSAGGAFGIRCRC